MPKRCSDKLKNDGIGALIQKLRADGAPAINQVRQLYSPLASDMHFVRDIAYGSDMRYARLKLQRRIEYHCDHREQYHFCGAKISRRAVRGISLRSFTYRHCTKKV